MSEDNEKIGYLKYSGDNVAEGLFDMKKSAEALLGFDEMLRYFISKEEPLLTDVNYEIPVNIRKGSWEIILPYLATIPVGVYLTSIATKAGKDGFLETGPAKDVKKIFLGALHSIEWIIKIRNHRKDKEKRIEHLKFIENNEKIGIPNSDGEYLYVSKKHYDLYTQFPEKIFAKNTKLIEKNRVLEIGSIEADGKINNVKISEEEKQYYFEEELENNVILPELIHGDRVSLEGEITRTNENTNTIGFRYNGHVLMCKPLDKPLTYFKTKIVSNSEQQFFSNVILTGIVDRLNNEGDYKEKKPMIFFTDIQNVEKPNNGNTLF